VQWCRGLDLEEASRRLGLAPDVALAHWVGAIRETFEEVGLLLAYDERGEPMRVDAPRFADYRAECQASSHAFWDMVRAERLTLATERLMYFAHWITPEEQPLRFDTRFFAAAMLPGQEAVADLKEITEVRWLEPPEALAAARRAEISLRNATARNVELFVGATSARDAVERVAGREIRTIRPRVVLENGQRRVLMPDDPDWY
jgi:8-oxo-dGTP pyrophosphatase MutT (NUDIX family)